jgi:hypothetical protein
LGGQQRLLRLRCSASTGGRWRGAGGSLVGECHGVSGGALVGRWHCHSFGTGALVSEEEGPDNQHEWKG